MKVLLAGNLVATAVEKDKKFQPAIDDGEAIHVFTAYNYSGELNAVAHAQKTIDGLQETLNKTTSNWYVTVQRK